MPVQKRQSAKGTQRWKIFGKCALAATHARFAPKAEQNVKGKALTARLNVAEED